MSQRRRAPRVMPHRSSRLTAAAVASVFTAALAVGGLALPAQAADGEDGGAAIQADSAFSCTPGHVYTLYNDGAIREVDTATAAQTAIGTFVRPAGSPPLNGLAVTNDGQYAYALQNFPDPDGNVTIYRFDGTDGTTTTFPGATDVTLRATFVMGGIDPTTQIFYYAEWVDSSRTIDVYGFDTTTNTDLGFIGGIPGTRDSLDVQRKNGDLVFSSDGAMYLVSSSGDTNAADANVLLRVDQKLPTTGGTNPTLTTTQIITVPPTNRVFNGIAFDNGYLYLDARNAAGNGMLYQVDPSTGTMLSAQELGENAIDMASCQYNNTLTVRKSIVGHAVAGDQFTVQATTGGSPFGTVGTTTGTAVGLHAASREISVSVPLSGSDIVVSEAAVAGSDLSSYASRYECVDDDGTVVTRGSGTSGSFTFPAYTPNGSNVVCTFTNVPVGTVTLSKTWIGAIEGDTAGLRINDSSVTDAATSTATGDTPQFDDDHVARAIAAAGSTVTLGEVMAGSGRYSAGYQCTQGNASIDLNGGASFTMPTGSDPVECRVTNVNARVGVTVVKEWIIDGQAYANDQLPAGYTAADLTLTDQTDPEFGATYNGYAWGSSVTVGEQNEAVPAECVLTTTGDDATYALTQQDNRYTITNVVTCAHPAPPTPPVTPSGPDLPNTGGDLGGPLWQVGLLLTAGGVLALAWVRHRRARLE